MEKGFSSKITKEIYDKVIKHSLTAEQFFELSNRLKEYAEKLNYEAQRETLVEMMTKYRESIYNKTNF